LETGNLFFLFGLDTKFNIDPQLLSERFFEVCDLLHPDRCVNLPPQEQAAALNRMGIVNQAFEVLWGSTKRRWYILDRFAPEVNSSMLPLSIEWFELQETFEVIPDAKKQAEKFFEKLTQTAVSLKKEQIEIETRFDQTYQMHLLKALRELSVQEKTLDSLMQDVEQRLM
jgi:DnaJ-domain-containing protein 1